ncbi:bifunctional diaminohydroxyphosphoribosylaminopyrimidine deaminase/5-amino-6-(5-phosphoribosylamino)uracil reductase RibD [Aliivibrio kagoshimensis]|uniref:bifunctional diaminohydroxyphosphoribosylaminopyrimidine deaminase/5-amino-6-(5-phosphoribosylamino)uracil reductase RibD n=1 Tax=Aliivibrio kagoshimensis TaxID=2910230 RepID=UPI003D12EAA8
MLENRAFMMRALELSKSALPECSPNPPVGCVLVKEGEIISEGFTQFLGGEHAEAYACSHYNGSLKGTTAYVTLEPCSFVGRTPSCATSLVEKGIKKVVIAILDPDERNNGKGIEILQQAGIDVELGLCAEEVRDFISPFLVAQPAE